MSALIASGSGLIFGFLLGVVVYAAIIWGTVMLARTKGRSAGGWAVLAIFFSWIALLIVALLPSKQSPGA